MDIPEAGVAVEDGEGHHHAQHEAARRHEAVQHQPGQQRPGAGGQGAAHQQRVGGDGHEAVHALPRQRHGGLQGLVEAGPVAEQEAERGLHTHVAPGVLGRGLAGVAADQQVEAEHEADCLEAGEDGAGEGDPALAPGQQLARAQPLRVHVLAVPSRAAGGGRADLSWPQCDLCSVQARLYLS